MRCIHLHTPSERILSQCTEDQPLKIVEHSNIAVGDRRLKESIKQTP